MDFSPSPRAAELLDAVTTFMATHIDPVENDYHAEITALRDSGDATKDPWQPLPLMTELRAKAKEEGLWNLFLPEGHEGPYAERYGTRGGTGLSNVDYAPVAEAMGRSALAPYIFNCNAPDTGNAEVLLKYGSARQQEKWLDPLLSGEIRSAFCMTEPGVASSDATNMELTAVREGGDGGDGDYVINGRKWWSTGVGHPDCKVLLVMALTDPEADRHRRHSMILVPTDTEGVKVERMLDTMGLRDEPYGHGEVSFTDVRVPAENVIAGPGRAAEIAQGRLGPGRVHHCMRLIGLAEKCLELACQRGVRRQAFGKPLVALGGNRERIAKARIQIDSARLLVLNTAWKLDQGGPRNALSEVAQIKAAVPSMAQEVIDLAIQLHGGGGLSSDFPLAGAWTAARALRLADGPDEVHLGTVARIELAKYMPRRDQRGEGSR